MAKLDRTRPFGEVFGASADGTRFLQDDKSFNSDGEEIGAAKKTKPKAKAADPQLELPLKDGQ